MPEFEIKPYSDKYEDFVWQLHVKHNKSYIEKHFGWNEDSTREIQKNKIAESQVFVIFSDDKPIGCYFVSDEKDIYKLSRFFLIDEMQNKGIGKEVIRSVLDEYASITKPVLITVWLDNNAIEFWKKLGFQYFSQDENFTYMRYPQ